MSDEGIDVDGGELIDEGLDSGEFVVVEKGVEGHVDADAESVSITNEGSDILDAVACGSACAETRGTDIDRVGAVADSFKTTFKVTGRSKELNGSHRYCTESLDRRSS